MTMMATRWCWLALWLAVSPTVSDADFRRFRRERPCGNDLRGYLPCPDGQYCQRMTPFYFVCRPIHPRCAPLPGVRLMGEAVGFPYPDRPFCTRIQCDVGQCCEWCSSFPDCVAFNIGTHGARRGAPDGVEVSPEPVDLPICDCCLLRSVSGKVEDATAVSSFIDRDAECTTPPNSVCAIGDTFSKDTCCPGDQVCVSVAPQRSQCVDIPEACAAVEIQSMPTAAKNFHTPDCKAYTFYADAPGGPVCHLTAHGNATPLPHPTAVVGYLNSMYA
ncbi:hypothetical protein P43SY_011302 [Pythium insidiosum]|uniref:Uncharacterized protein n=1 Tax=Pythium insidiosum TaxID=114742 RepID=A0AAD5Q5C3_PYTIN|nr:hypothetical protein P43SY_011302 [Pythium insidiosum]